MSIKTYSLDSLNDASDLSIYEHGNLCINVDTALAIKALSDSVVAESLSHENALCKASMLVSDDVFNWSWEYEDSDDVPTGIEPKSLFTSETRLMCNSIGQFWFETNPTCEGVSPNPLHFYSRTFNLDLTSIIH